MQKIILFIFLFFISATPVYASSISLSSSQTSLSANEEFLVDTQLSVNAPDGTLYYLRGEFYLSEGQYCGYTWNGNSWFNGSVSGDGYKNLQQISISDNLWTGQLRAKIDANDNSCLSSGSYYFRIQRYTNTGNPSTDSMTPLPVFVIIPTLTPSPTAAAENSTPTPNATPTPTPTPTRSPTPPPTKKPTPRPTPTPEETNLAETVSESGSVLGAGSETPPPETPVSESGNSSRSPVLAIIFITLGILLMGTAGYSIWVKSKTPPVQNAV